MGIFALRQDFIQWCGGIVKFDVVIGHKYLVLSISSREDDAAGETKTLARFIQLFKVIIALAYMLLVVGIIAFFSQLEGYVKVHHDNFYGQVYSFICDGGWVGVCLGAWVQLCGMWNNGVGALPVQYVHDM